MYKKKDIREDVIFMFNTRQFTAIDPSSVRFISITAYRDIAAVQPGLRVRSEDAGEVVHELA